MLLTSIPIGYLADWVKEDERTLKGIQACGFVGFALSYVIAGPSNLPGATTFDGLHWFMFATALKGASSATLNACFNDLLLGIAEDDDTSRSRLSGLWNVAQMLGVVASGLLGPLQDAFQFDGLCTITAMTSLLFAAGLFIVAHAAGPVQVLPNDLNSLSTEPTSMDGVGHPCSAEKQPIDDNVRLLQDA